MPATLWRGLPSLARRVVTLEKLGFVVQCFRLQRGSAKGFRQTIMDASCARHRIERELRLGRNGRQLEAPSRTLALNSPCAPLTLLQP